MKHYTLLIWELIPEDTTTYLIPNDEAAKFSHHLEEANHRIINVHDMNDGMLFLSEETCNEVPDQNRSGVLVKYKYASEKGAISDGVVTHIYISGFYL